MSVYLAGIALGIFVGYLTAFRVLMVWVYDRTESLLLAGELAMSVYLAGIALGIFVGYLTAFRVLIVWVYDRTESLFLGMLMHASITASLLVLNPLEIAGAHLQMYSFALAGAVWVVVAAIAVRTGWRLEHQPLRTAQRAA